MYTSNSHHEQIYRTQSCLIVIMIAVLAIHPYEKIFPVGKLKDVTDGTQDRQYYKLRERLCRKEVLAVTAAKIS